MSIEHELADAKRELHAVRVALSGRHHDPEVDDSLPLSVEIDMLRKQRDSLLISKDILQHSNDQLRQAVETVNNEVRELRQQMRVQLAARDRTINWMVDAVGILPVS